MKIHTWRALTILILSSVFCSADEVPIGVLSFDVFIPPSGAPGVNAFDVFNFTGPTYGPTLGPPYVANSISLDDISLTVFFASGGSQTFTPDDLDPGELFDGLGNPVIQFPSTTTFTSALLTASLSSTTLQLSDGSAFNASPSISVDLVPSSGSTLIAGVDLLPINAESAAVVSSPEPRSRVLFLGGSFILVVAFLRRRVAANAL